MVDYTGQEKPRSLTAKLAAWFLLFASVGVVAWAVQVAALGVNSGFWPWAPGVVKSSEIIRIDRKLTPKVRVLYRVGGKQLECDTIFPGPYSKKYLPSPRKYMAKYPADDSAAVFYNPKNPSQSLLEPGVTPVMALYLCFGLACFFGSLWLVCRMSAKPAHPALPNPAKPPPGIKARPEPLPGPGKLCQAAGVAAFFFASLTAIYYVYPGAIAWPAADAQNRVLAQKARHPLPQKKAATPGRQVNEGPMPGGRLERAPEQIRADSAKLKAVAERYLKAGQGNTAERSVSRRMELTKSEPVLAGQVPDATINMARVYFLQRRYDEAEIQFHQALELLKEHGRAESGDAARAMAGLAKVYHAQGKARQVRPLFKQAIDIWDGIKGRGNPESVKIARDYARILRDSGMDQEAAQLEESADGMALAWKPSMARPEKEKTPSGEVRIVAPGPDTRVVHLSLSRHTLPSKKFLGASNRPASDSILTHKPRKIRKVPEYGGHTQRYGSLHLGQDGETEIYFVLDQPGEGHPVLYFDANANLDLTDDGGPITHMGQEKDFFAARVSLPLGKVIPGLKEPGRFYIWIYTSKKDWERNKASHYSVTGLTGTVKLAGKKRPFQITDSGVNDANLTNDGVYIDVNGDGHVVRSLEYVPRGKAVVIGNGEYQFKVDG